MENNETSVTNNELNGTEQKTEQKPEVTEVKTEETKTQETEQKTEPTTQELMVEIAKLKRAADKNASEAKEWKEKYRSTMSEKEIMDAEKAEAQAARDAEFEEMKKTLQIHDLAENFMDLGYNKELAKKAATAQVEGDTQALLGFQKQFQEAQKKSWEEDFIKSRPDINIGIGTGGNSYTKEQFDSMSLVEKTKLRRENEAEYNRLLAL